MEYFVKFSAILGLFYIFYKLFLEKETFFNSIRAYFVLGIITALVTPLIVIPEYVYIEDLFAGQTITASAAETPSSESGQFDLMTILLIVYGAGIIFFAIRFLMQLASLVRFILKLPKKKIGRFIFISTEESISPFSFFNYIIYPNNGFDENELDQIIAHEKVHATQFHTLDIMLSQLLIIFNWFNPVAWLYHKEIQKNLEFIADEGAQRRQGQKESYQYLLLKTITPNYSLALTSNFYNSLIKKRINMLHKNKSGNMMYFKFMFIIPALIAFVFTFNTKVIAQQKKVENIEIHTELEVEVITADFQKSDLEELKSSLLTKGITLQYKKLKYNDNNKIIAIKVLVSNKQNNKTQIEQMGSAPIKPISIKFDNKGALAVGNLEGMEDQNVFFTTESDDDGNNVFIHKSGKDSKNHDENFVWVSKNGDQTKVKVINGKKVMVETTGNNEWEEKVWVSESGDTTKIKKIEIIEIDESTDGEENIIIKKIHKKGDANVEVTVNVSDDKHKGKQKMIFISEGGEQPLMIVDGEEKSNMKMDEISPEDIETIEVLKGDKAVEKYGDKAKDGVIMITTKK